LLGPSEVANWSSAKSMFLFSLMSMDLLGKQIISISNEIQKNQLGKGMGQNYLNFYNLLPKWRDPFPER
jgi:hypothetical protein